MKYPLFISDFDGTLVRADGTVSARNREAIARYSAQGGRFAICTGRSIDSILPRARELGMEQGLLVAFQGALVYDIGEGKLVKDGRFTEEQALRVVRFLEGKGEHIHIYPADGFYSNVRDVLLGWYEKICKITAQIEPNLSELIVREHIPVIKVLVMLEEGRKAQLIEELKEELGEEYFVTSSASVLVEITPRANNKGAAVEFLANYYSVPLERVAAIGDQLNDLPMLERAGGRFTVANAEEQLKGVAQVVSSNEEDGVAEALEIAMGEENE